MAGLPVAFLSSCDNHDTVRSLSPPPVHAALLHCTTFVTHVAAARKNQASRADFSKLTCGHGIQTHSELNTVTCSTKSKTEPTKNHKQTLIVVMK